MSNQKSTVTVTSPHCMKAGDKVYFQVPVFNHWYTVLWHWIIRKHLPDTKEKAFIVQDSTSTTINVSPVVTAPEQD